MARHGAEVSFCVKWTLFFFNLAVLIGGMIALGVGIYGRLLQNDWDDVANISTDPAVLLIIGGAICTLLGAFGTVGALRENVCLLKLYYYGISILILLEIGAAVAAFVFQEQLRDTAGEKMLEGIRLYRTTNEQTNLDDAVQAVQESLCCCGATSPRDWIDNNLYHNCTRNTFRRVLSACGVPPSCCQMHGETNSQCGYVVFPFPGMTPDEQALWPSIDIRDTLIYTQGCNDALYNWIVGNYAVLGGVAAGILVLQIITVFMAISMKDNIEYILMEYDATSGPNTKRYS